MNKQYTPKFITYFLLTITLIASWQNHVVLAQVEQHDLYVLTATPPKNVALGSQQISEAIWKIDSLGTSARLTTLDRLLLEMPAPSLSAEELSFMKQLGYEATRANPLTVQIENVVVVSENRIIILLKYSSCDNLTDKCAGYYELRLLDGRTGKLLSLLLRVDHHGSKFIEMGCSEPTILPLVMTIRPSPLKHRFAVEYSGVKGCYAGIQPLIEIYDLEDQSLKKLASIPKITGFNWSTDATSIAFYQYSTINNATKVEVIYTDVTMLKQHKIVEISQTTGAYFAMPIVWIDPSTFVYVWYRFRGEVEPTLNWYDTSTLTMVSAQLPSEYGTFIGDGLGLTLYASGLVGIPNNGILTPISKPENTGNPLSELTVKGMIGMFKLGVKFPRYTDYLSYIQTNSTGCISKVEFIYMPTGAKTIFDLERGIRQPECVLLFDVD